ncbi:sulfatase-like hydrolase/transferase [Vallitalea okinawensis]|uniref:sulfatase-like hydrolase/transferase n=1 Tax=Vallitalea okinawensis TaxID=2078660 RepID=UPI000CFCD555|nr:sulfatase-like hydrolase/transferase [Vallitalea okinawensis]
MKIKNINLYLVILLLGVKLYMFYATIYTNLESLLYSIVYTSIIIFLIGWIGYSLKVNRWIFLVLDSLLSILMLIDLLYYNYFNELPSIQLISQIKYLAGVGQSVWLQVRLWMIYLVIEPVLALFMYKHMDQKENQPVYGSVILAGLLLLFMITSPILIKSSMNSLIYNEVFTYHVKDFVPEKELIHDLPYIEEAEYKESIYNGIGKNKNIIIIQMEAFQDFPIQLLYNGQEVTPVLNDLISEESIYFENYYQQLGKGGTSDAEFITLNSLHPTIQSYVYEAYANNDFYGLPWILKDQGYTTMMFHGNVGDYWNREEASVGQGFDHFISIEDMDSKEILGMGMSDKELFDQSISYLENQQRFLAFYTTLSSHYPFDIGEENNQFNLLEEHKGTLFGNYLKAINYVDQSIGKFLDDLKDRGLYEDSMIVFYGDHFGLHMKEEENQKYMSQLLGKFYNYDEMLKIPLIIHIPGSHINKTISTVGGQIDFLPTILDITGLSQMGTVMLGQNLFTAQEGFVAFQTYLLKGSYLDDHTLFMMSRDGIYENSQAYNLQTGATIGLDETREGYERAIQGINYSKHVLDHNLLRSNEIYSIEDQQSNVQKPEFIAHGGGGINGTLVSNSKEALDESIRKGVNFIEVDLVWTSDQVPVLLHGWDGFITRLFQVGDQDEREEQHYSHNEFMNLQMKNGLHQLDLKALMDWMEENQNAYIITDIKEDNIKMLELIASEYKEYQHRIIPQIYAMDEYIQVYYMGYKNIILTLYKSEYTAEQIKDFINRYEVFAVTMPIERAYEGLAEELQKEEVFIYCHTVNDEELVVELREKGVDGFYSDNLHN